jgi:hypothetical protein
MTAGLGGVVQKAPHVGRDFMDSRMAGMLFSVAAVSMAQLARIVASTFILDASSWKLIEVTAKSVRMRPYL